MKIIVQTTHESLGILPAYYVCDSCGSACNEMPDTLMLPSRPSMRNEELLDLLERNIKGLSRYNDSGGLQHKDEKGMQPDNKGDYIYLSDVISVLDKISHWLHPVETTPIEKVKTCHQCKKPRLKSEWQVDCDICHAVIHESCAYSKKFENEATGDDEYNYRCKSFSCDTNEGGHPLDIF